MECEYTKLLSEAGISYLRPQDEDESCVGPLRIGGNELLGDQELFHWGRPKIVNFWIEADARLPDERVLFAFAVYLEMNI